MRHLRSNCNGQHLPIAHQVPVFQIYPASSPLTQAAALMAQTEALTRRPHALRLARPPDRGEWIGTMPYVDLVHMTPFPLLTLQKAPSTAKWPM